MRLYLAPLAEPLLRRKSLDRPFCVLDVDDDEVLTRHRLAHLHRAYGDDQRADDEALEAERYARLAERYLPAFERIAVSSQADQGRLATAFPQGHFRHLPNGYDTLSGRPQAARRGGPLRLIFVGSLDYFPNADAIRFFCSQCLPRLRGAARQQIRVDIIGGGGADLRSAFASAGVTFHGSIADLRQHYRDADVAIVPIRAGGGTRIKILEAFAQGIPVVSTTIGAEGLGATGGEHLLIADDAEAFANACWRLKSSPALAEEIARNATTLCRQNHSRGAIAASIRSLYEPVLG
jgi:glycosyltransferase involved in cell wall biosynthesis